MGRHIQCGQRKDSLQENIMELPIKIVSEQYGLVKQQRSIVDTRKIYFKQGQPNSPWR